MKKPLKPKVTIQIASSGGNDSIPKPIQILASQLCEDQRLLLVYGNYLKPVFEKLVRRKTENIHNSYTPVESWTWLGKFLFWNVLGVSMNMWSNVYSSQLVLIQYQNWHQVIFICRYSIAKQKKIMIKSPIL